MNGKKVVHEVKIMPDLALVNAIIHALEVH